MKQKTGQTIKILILCVVLILSFVLSLLLGAEKPSIFLIKYLRLPRSVLVLLSGALLASSGALFQMFFRNSLAEPGLLGISAGATLGAVTAASFGGLALFGGFISSVSFFAFLGAFISGLILALISSSGKRISSVMLLLCGTALGTFYSGISSAVMLMHNKELHGIFSWLLGSFNGRGINELKFVMLPAVLAFILMAFVQNQLDLLNGGEENAGSLGLNVNRLRLLVICGGSLAVSVAVCGGGTISFVGLVAPHIMRKIFSPKSKMLLWTSALGGAILLLVADTLARVIIRPAELPCGIITSFVGVPFFLALIFSNKKNASEKSSFGNDSEKSEALVALKDFSFSYGEEQVLSNITLSLKPGDFICLCGPNGSGKSTLLKGLYDSLKNKTHKEKARLVSYLPQNEEGLWDYTVFDTVLSGRFCYTGPLGHYSKEDYDEARKAIKEFNLESLSEKSIHELSGGEFQKVRLARSFAQGTPCLLLDEPLSSLDYVASDNLMKTLKEKCRLYNKAVIISVHDLNTASRFADEMVLLGKHNGQQQLFFKGKTKEVMTSENLTAVYNASTKVFIHPELNIPQI